MVQYQILLVLVIKSESGFGLVMDSGAFGLGFDLDSNGLVSRKTLPITTAKKGRVHYILSFNVNLKPISNI